ncbi:MAG: YraN family protein [Sphingobacteriales bacterium]|nr:MAG: YraN family protein [Sphingobacteriales bacterium]
MAKHNETGIKGEQLAQNFLLNKGYSVLHTNWCFGKKEVDVVAEQNGLLIFVEVKTRASAMFGYPEEAVNMRKMGFLKEAAEAFMELHPEYQKVQFDIISILLDDKKVKEIRHFEDAFY